MTSSDVDINLLHLKLDALEARVKVLESMNKFPMQTVTRSKFGSIEGIKSSCIWENLSPEDYNKPMGISCPCPKCSTYSM